MLGGRGALNPPLNTFSIGQFISGSWWKYDSALFQTALDVFLSAFSVMMQTLQSQYSEESTTLTYTEVLALLSEVSTVLYRISRPFRHLCIQFHQCSIQFRPEKLTALKSNVQFRQIVIHIRFLTIKFKNSAFKFFNWHWNSSVSLGELGM